MNEQHHVQKRPPHWSLWAAIGIITTMTASAAAYGATAHIAAETGAESDAPVSPSQCRETTPQRYFDDYGELEFSELTALSPSGEYMVNGDELFGHRTENVELKTTEAQRALGYEDLDPDDPSFHDPSSPVGYESLAGAVNDSGTVVGSVPVRMDQADQYGGYWSSTGWRYRNGRYSELELPDELRDDHSGNWSVTVVDVDDDGTAVGYAEPLSAPEEYLAEPYPTAEVTPLRWDGDSTTATILDDKNARATAIDHDGTVVGVSMDFNRDVEAPPRTVWRWSPDGRTEELPFPDLTYDDGSGDPQITGDWLLVGDRRMNLRDMAAEPAGPVPTAAFWSGRAKMSIDRDGRIWTTDDESRRPIVRDGDTTVNLAIDDRILHPKDPADEYLGTNLVAVAETPTIILGEHETTESLDDFDTIPTMWRC